MFDRIARVYDLLNTVMTAGLHHQWRRRAADLAQLSDGGRALDVATGTGDLAFELAGRVGASGEVIAVDFSEQMLAVARQKAAASTDRARASVVRFEQANALALPYSDGAFDAATVGFGARNFGDLERGLSEIARVLRPGGRVVILEMTTPRRAPLSVFFKLWFDRIVPLLGRVAGDPEAYSYLPSSVRRFPAPVALADTMSRCGFSDIRYILTAGGIIALHVGTGSRMSAQGAAVVSAVVDAGGVEVSRVMQAVETRMQSLAGGHGRQLAHHASSTISAGGKRLRPLLVCLSAGVPAPESAALVRAAVAVELIHAATLVHDDVLDGSSLRRGRPTVFAAGGRLDATATGDLLFSRAFAELAAGASASRSACSRARARSWPPVS